MKEQIDLIQKHVTKIKEIADTNEEQLQYHSSELNIDEQKKILKNQKLTDEITSYNIINEFKKERKINKYIRYAYFGIIGTVLGLLILISSDYLYLKYQSIDTNKLIEEKNIIIKQNNNLKAELEDIKTSNNDLKELIIQKDDLISNLKKQTTTVSQNNINIKEAEKNISSVKINEENIENLKKECFSTTTITINMRNNSGLDGDVIGFITEGTKVQVLEKNNSAGRDWYKVKDNNNIGWISSIGIESFNDSCLN